MSIKTNFKIDENESINLCLEYSEDKKTLKNLINRLNIEINIDGFQKSHWDKDLKCVAYTVTINKKLTFDFYGSHSDYEILSADYANRFGKKVADKIKSVRNSVLYSVLCSIRLDYSLTECEPEDLGYSSDSIKDMASWNEAIKHAKKLISHLKLSEEEFESLPQ